MSTFPQCGQSFIAFLVKSSVSIQAAFCIQTRQFSFVIAAGAITDRIRGAFLDLGSTVWHLGEVLAKDCDVENIPRCRNDGAKIGPIQSKKSKSS